jgi:hypothetical protein
MGYYIELEGTVDFFAEDEARIVAGMKALNHRHDLKTGGRHPETGDPYEDKWFAWVEARYHEDESITTVADILGLLGIRIDWSLDDRSVTLDSALGDRRLGISYENKIGAHEVWFAELARLGVYLNLEVKGEDGEHWRWSTHNGTGTGVLRTWELKVRYGTVVYGEPMTV